MADKRRGRPKSDDPAKHTMVVRCTSGERLDLRRVAAENRTTPSGVIREAVNSYVADYSDRKVFRITRKYRP